MLDFKLMQLPRRLPPFSPWCSWSTAPQNSTPSLLFPNFLKYRVIWTSGEKRPLKANELSNGGGGVSITSASWALHSWSFSISSWFYSSIFDFPHEKPHRRFYADDRRIYTAETLHPAPKSVSRQPISIKTFKCKWVLATKIVKITQNKEAWL